MKQEELARENHKFFYVDFVTGLMEENGYFDHTVCRAARIHSEISRDEGIQNGKKPIPDDRFGAMSFSCQNGEIGYVQISGESAKLFYERTVDIDKVLHRIPRSIQGEHNDRCVILTDNGIEVIIRIIAYERIANDKLSLIKDPANDSILDGTPLGRVVIITASPNGGKIPESELVNCWVKYS